MPQTRFVLQKALSLGKVPIVVINKVDKPECTPDLVRDQVFELFFNLDATEEQLDFTTYTVLEKKSGWDQVGKNQPKTLPTYWIQL